MRDNQENARKEYSNLFNELAKDKPDAGRVAQIKQNILTLESKCPDSMINNANGLKKVLTKEQFTKFQEKQKGRGKKEKAATESKPE
jgi:Spy/CpxP family protein refolding chaperone